MANFITIESDGFTDGELADIDLCLRTLLSVQEGEQPMDREFGINLSEVLGAPLNVAQNKLFLAVAEKVAVYEPRVEVESIEFDADTDGQVVPHIYFVKAEED